MRSSLPPPSQAAFLLDFDGTLVDIAPTPDEIVLPADLADHLHRLRALCGGALAIVSGRSIAQIDGFLGEAAYAVAGEHGTALRPAPGAPIEWLPMPDPPSDWPGAAQSIAARHPGVTIEPKRHGFVLHYRAAPDAGSALHAALQALIGARPGAYDLLAAKMAWEIRPHGTDKATAVRALMRHPPFAGRLPIFVGDDITDEDGMREACAMGGLGLRVDDAFGDAAGVRAWIADLVAGAGEGAAWSG